MFDRKFAGVRGMRKSISNKKPNTSTNNKTICNKKMISNKKMNASTTNKKRVMK